MKIGDVLSLYTHGYTKEQIATIKEVYESDESILEAAKEVKSFDELTDLIALASEQKQNPSGDNVQDPQPESAAENEQIAELESLRKDKAELEAKLQKVQEDNASRDVSGNKEAPENTVTDLFKNLI